MDIFKVMGDLLPWFQAMERLDIGQIYLSNLLHDWLENRLSRQLICEFLNDVIQRWSVNQPFTSHDDESQQALTAFNDKRQAYILKGPKVFRDWQWCSRVVHAKDLIRYNIRREALGLGQEETIPEEDIDDLVTLLFSSSYPLISGINENSMMKGGKGYAWVTKTPSFNQMLQNAANHPQCASIIRDLLGLNHLKHGQIIGIVYPEEVINEQNVLAPTFIEGDLIVYRSCCADDGWGRTTDLKTYDSSQPEAIHPPVRFSAQFQLEKLGSLNPPPPEDIVECWSKMRHQWIFARATEIQKECQSCRSSS